MLGKQNKGNFVNMLNQSPLHLLAMESHCIRAEWMEARITALLNQGFALFDSDVNGCNPYHIACICFNARFLMSALGIDKSFVKNLNRVDNAIMSPLDYLKQYWRKTSKLCLIHMCVDVIREPLLNYLSLPDHHIARMDETVKIMKSDPIYCTIADCFVYEMHTSRLSSIPEKLKDIRFDQRSIQLLFDSKGGVLKHKQASCQEDIVTVLGLLHCIGQEMGKHDDSFLCSPELKGSILENTKCGGLDEIDVTLKLVNFTQQFTAELVEIEGRGLHGDINVRNNCQRRRNFHCVQLCCNFWLTLMQSFRTKAVQEYLHKNFICIDNCHRKNGFTGTLYVRCGSRAASDYHTKGKMTSIAVDVTPGIQVDEFICLLFPRHYDRQQVGHFYPTRLELSTSMKDWILLKYVPPEIMHGYILVKLLRPLTKTFQPKDSSKRIFSADDILPSYMIKSSLLWVLDQEDRFQKEYTSINKDYIFKGEDVSSYKNDVTYLCRNLISHARICSFITGSYHGTGSCLSPEDVERLQDIQAKCTKSHLHLPGRDRILPYVLMTQRNAAHNRVQNGINVDQLWQKVYDRLARQGFLSVNTENEVIYQRQYYSQAGREATHTGAYPDSTIYGFLGEEVGQGSDPNISLEMARRCRVWAMRALRLIVILLKKNESVKNYYLPHQVVPARDADLTIGLCEAFIALLE